MWKIYKHTLLVGDHANWSYIGLTKQAEKNRWKNGLGYNKQIVFWRAIEKYSWDNFSHEIIEDNIATIKEANEREKYWIAFYHTYINDPLCAGYNLTKGGDGSFGYKWTLDSRKKLSKVKTGIHHTDEYNAKLSKATGGGTVICIETGETYYSLGDAYRQTGIRHIPECVGHKQNRAGGYHWAYEHDTEWYDKFKSFSGKPRLIINSTPKKICCIELNKTFQSLKQAAKFAQELLGTTTSQRANLSRSLKTGGRCAGYHWKRVD